MKSNYKTNNYYDAVHFNEKFIDYMYPKENGTDIRVLSDIKEFLVFKPKIEKLYFRRMCEGRRFVYYVSGTKLDFKKVKKDQWVVVSRENSVTIKGDAEFQKECYLVPDVNFEESLPF